MALKKGQMAQARESDPSATKRTQEARRRGGRVPVKARRSRTRRTETHKRWNSGSRLLWTKAPLATTAHFMALLDDLHGRWLRL